MSLQEQLARLAEVPGVRSAALVTSDGEFVAGCLHQDLTRDVLSALASFVGKTTNRGLAEAGLPKFTHLSLLATHGRMFMVQTEGLYLVCLADQFVDDAVVWKHAREAAQRLQRVPG